MTYSEKHLDHIDDYLRQPGRNGHPPMLNKEIEQDPELKAAYQDVEMLWQATRLERLQGKLEMLRKYAGELNAEAPDVRVGTGKAEERPARVISLNTKRILSIAAGILLIAVVGWFLLNPQEPMVMQHAYLAEHFDEYVLHDVTKGVGATQYTSDQLQAYDLFAIQSFDKAIPRLELLWSDRNDSLALFYLITAHIGTGNVVKAKALLNEGKRSTNPGAANVDRSTYGVDTSASHILNRIILNYETFTQP